MDHRLEERVYVASYCACWACCCVCCCTCTTAVLSSVDVAAPLSPRRYVVKNTLSSSTKAMAKCMSRLGEALNLLPRTDTQSLGTSIVAALAAGRGVPLLSSPSNHSTHSGEQQDLRRQQVRCQCAMLLCCYFAILLLRTLTRFGLGCSSSA